MYIGGFYLQPDRFVKLEISFNKIMDRCKNNSGPTIIIVGDFNAGDIYWDENLIESHSQKHLFMKSYYDYWISST